MTFYNVVLASAGVAAVVGTFRAYYWYVRHDLSRLRKYEQWTDVFIANAKPLIADPETPAAVLETLRHLNDMIGERGAAASVAHIFGNMAKGARPGVGKNHAVFDRFFAKRPELQKSFVSAISAGLLAVTYSSLLVGWVARARLAEAVEMRDRPAALSKTVEQVDARIHSAGCGGGLVTT